MVDKLQAHLIHANSDMMYAAIVAGNNLGQVWTIDSAESALYAVWSEYFEGVHFMGCTGSTSKSAFLAFRDNTWLPFLREKGLDCLEFSCDTQEIAVFVLAAFADHRELKQYKACVFKLPQGGSVNAVAPLASYDITEVDACFAGQLSKIENRDILMKIITQTCGGMLQFLEHGVGFVALQNNRICSFALTHFHYLDTCCVGVETFEPHKRKGLSSQLSSLLCARIAQRGGRIWWDCHVDNIASVKTAQKIGLVVSHDYDIYWFDI